MASFFGLTALGPDSVFSQGLFKAISLTAFDDREYERGFQQVAGPNAGIAKAQIAQLLNIVYSYPPLEEELQFLLELLEHKADDEVITCAEFVDCIHAVGDALEDRSKAAKEFTSWNDFRNTLYRHRRLIHAPSERFKFPITAGQEYGWYSQKQPGVRFPRKSCEETRYADCMVKSGAYL
eukprot:GILK01003103.1.p1 GENE.GILK01003103.1~~GILK01003103.1.p1  ORF type:complete len:180 (+),score=17.39 GILK01003103.1:54-593(+)